jgi:DNA-directed RNA polymerase subunit beta
MEPNIARDSGVTMVARRSGTVVMVDGARIVVKPDSDPSNFDPMSVKPDIYNLVKFRRTNQNTSFNQKPIVRKGHRRSRKARSSPTAPPPKRRAGTRQEPRGGVHALGRIQL